MVGYGRLRDAKCGDVDGNFSDVERDGAADKDATVLLFGVQVVWEVRRL